ERIREPALSTQGDTAVPSSAEGGRGSANAQGSIPVRLRRRQGHVKLQNQQNAGLIADLRHDLEGLGQLTVRRGESRVVRVENAETCERVRENVTIADLEEKSRPSVKISRASRALPSANATNPKNASAHPRWAWSRTFRASRTASVYAARAACRLPSVRFSQPSHGSASARFHSSPSLRDSARLSRISVRPLT